MMTGYAAQSIALYQLIRYPSPITAAEINRINSHPQPFLLYQAMLTQSYYPQMFIDNSTHFIALTNPLCNPVVVLQTLLERNHLPLQIDSPASSGSSSSSGSSASSTATGSTVIFHTPPTPIRELNNISPANPAKS